MVRVGVAIVLGVAAACGDDAPPPRDGGVVDAGPASDPDGGGARDTGDAPTEGGGAVLDARPRVDAGPRLDAGPRGPLPSGDEGIAARYPNDEGIEADPAVIFHDDFESYATAADLDGRWSAVYHNARIATEAGNARGGRRSLEFRSPQQSAELSNGVARTLAPEHDVLFLRFYSKFEGTFDVTGSSHNGGGISAHYFVDGNATPGVPADGRNKFLVEYECWRGEVTDPSPGVLNAYVYHPEQRSQWGDHFLPTGDVLPNTSIPGNFGPEFVARPDVVPELGRWYAYELMVRANTPGERDGAIALWLDGALIAHFTNLRLRDVPTLRIDRFNLSLHIGSNTVAETRKWYDDVVAATEYIGPVYVP